MENDSHFPYTRWEANVWMREVIFSTIDDLIKHWIQKHRWWLLINFVPHTYAFQKVNWGVLKKNLYFFWMNGRAKLLTNRLQMTLWFNQFGFQILTHLIAMLHITQFMFFEWLWLGIIILQLGSLVGLQWCSPVPKDYPSPRWE
jgi:hypothetical protein